MPIWLRRYTFNEIKEHYQNTNKASKQDTEPSQPKIDKPDISPTYKSKASKK